MTEMAAVAVWGRDVDEPGDQWFVFILPLGLARGCESSHGLSVVGPVTGDKLVPARLAVLLVVLASDLECDLVGFGATVREEEDVVVFQPLVELLAEPDSRQVALGQGVVGHGLQLIVGSLCQLLAAVADVHAPQSRHAVEVAISTDVRYPGPVGLRDYHRGGLGVVAG